MTHHYDLHSLPVGSQRRSTRTLVRWRRLALRLLLAWLVVQTLACFPEKGELRVVHQAAPNPLVGVKRYAVAPVTWNGFTYEGQTEAAWAATRTPEQRASFA